MQELSRFHRLMYKLPPEIFNMVLAEFLYPEDFENFSAALALSEEDDNAKTPSTGDSDSQHDQARAENPIARIVQKARQQAIIIFRDILAPPSVPASIRLQHNHHELRQPEEITALAWLHGREKLRRLRDGEAGRGFPEKRVAAAAALSGNTAEDFRVARMLCYPDRSLNDELKKIKAEYKEKHGNEELDERSKNCLLLHLLRTWDVERDAIVAHDRIVHYVGEFAGDLDDIHSQMLIALLQSKNGISQVRPSSGDESERSEELSLHQSSVNLARLFLDSRDFLEQEPALASNELRLRYWSRKNVAVALAQTEDVESEDFQKSREFCDNPQTLNSIGERGRIGLVAQLTLRGRDEDVKRARAVLNSLDGTLQYQPDVHCTILRDTLRRRGEEQDIESCRNKVRNVANLSLGQLQLVLSCAEMLRRRGEPQDIELLRELRNRNNGDYLQAHSARMLAEESSVVEISPWDYRLLTVPVPERIPSLEIRQKKGQYLYLKRGDKDISIQWGSGKEVRRFSIAETEKCPEKYPWVNEIVKRLHSPTREDIQQARWYRDRNFSSELRMDLATTILRSKYKDAKDFGKASDLLSRWWEDVHKARNATYQRVHIDKIDYGIALLALEVLQGNDKVKNTRLLKDLERQNPDPACCMRPDSNLPLLLKQAYDYMNREYAIERAEWTREEGARLRPRPPREGRGGR